MIGKRVLVVDDNADIRKALADLLLKPAGYVVAAASDGAEGLKLAREFRPDLLLLDYEMPFFSGLQVMAALRDEGCMAPAILLTAQSAESLLRRAMRAGFCDYLVKPLGPDEVLEAVERALSRPPCPPPPDPPAPALSPLEAGRSLDLRLREMETLSRLTRSLTAQLDLEAVLNAVVEAAVTLTGAEEGTLLLVDQATDELYMRAAKNFDQAMAHTLRLKVADSLAGEVIRRRAPLTLSTATAHKIVTAYMVKDLIYVPLLQDGTAIGVLGVDNRVANRSFDDHDVRLLSYLADYAVIAIRNASLYTETQRERDTLDAILSKTEDAVIVTDPEGRVMILNPPARAAFGVDEENVIGRPLREVIDNETLLELFAWEGTAGRALVGEVEIKTGETLHAQVTRIDGVGRVAVMQDITSLKKLDRIKSEFVTTVSHNLRSPLTAILGYVELMERAGDLNDQQRKFVERIIFSVQSITALISELLTMGRIEAGFDADREPTPIRVVIQYAVESQRSFLEARGHTFQMDLPEELPDVKGNPLRLKQMFVHLLDNAIRYTPEGGVVGLRAHATNGLVIVQVWDNGVGIPAQEQHRIFEKFYRARNVVEMASGAGLGLPMVKSIVEQHNGRVWVESQEGAGSTFTVMLPAHAPETPAPASLPLLQAERP